MKTYYLLYLSVITFLFISCKKEGIKPSGDTSFLEGNWKCVYVFGNNWGSPYFNDSTSYVGQTLTINNKGQYVTNFIYDGYENNQSGILKNVELVDSSKGMADFYPTLTNAHKINFEMIKPKNGTTIFYDNVLVFKTGKSSNAFTNPKETEGEKLIIRFWGNSLSQNYLAFVKN
jgi:hypothetical protein